MFPFIVVSVWVIGMICFVYHMITKRNKLYKECAYYFKNTPNTEYMYIKDIEVLFDENIIIKCVILKEVNTPHRIIIRKEYFKKNFAKKFQQY